MTKILDGRLVAKELNKQTEKVVEKLKKKNIIPTLAIMRANKNPASIQYENASARFMDKLGIETKRISFPDGVSEADFLEALEKLNQDSNIHGILVMQPLPKNISRSRVAEKIDPEKDVDGMHVFNLGRIMAEDAHAMLPSTVKAVMEIIRFYDLPVKGQDVCVVGKSNTVGKPLSVLLMNLDATVTNCHIYTKGLAHHTRQADLLITATGAIGLITADHVKPGATVIDVGFNFEGNKVYGDVVYKEVFEKAEAITPVPGGVGSVTTASLARQVALSAEVSQKSEE